MKIFIPYLFSSSPELRYCLRSIEKYMPNDGVVICGAIIPDWLVNVEFVFFQDIKGEKHKGNNTHGKLLSCVLFLGTDFIAYNDDYFLLQPWDFKNYYWNKLIDNYKPNTWGEAVKNTIKLVGNIDNYEVHCPIVFNAEKIAALDFEPCQFGQCVKSIYAHKYQLTGEAYPDMKIRTPCASADQVKEKIQGRKFFSTHESAMDDTMISVLEELYPTKSKFEK